MAVQNEVWLAIGSGADNADNTGSGTPESPYIVNTPATFVSRFNAIDENKTIRLMPGIFSTWGTDGAGYDMVQDTLTPKPGQRVVGSGIFATTLRLVWNTSGFNLPSAIDDYFPGQAHKILASDNYLSSFELSDLTLDCNLQNTPKPFGPTIDSIRHSFPVKGSVGGTAMSTSEAFFDAQMV